MTPEQLREAVARAIFGPGGLSGGMRETHLHPVNAAIARAALEEAAKVADDVITRDQCVAAAIRAYISGPGTSS